MKISAQSFKQGFTLIELLVVIAVIGVLATIVLLAANPAEQLARGRDTSRVSSITQMGRGLQGYYTANGAVYPASATWNTDLTAQGDVKAIPAQPTYSVAGTAACVTAVNNGWCYKVSGQDVILYGRLESALYDGKCTEPAEAFWVFSGAAARAGGVCATTGAGNEPLVTVSTFDF